jgi:hypothetical protein
MGIETVLLAETGSYVVTGAGVIAEPEIFCRVETRNRI